MPARRPRLATVRRRLYLDASPGERRGVVVLDGQPERLLIERDGEADRPRLGEIWRGRVGAAAPGFKGVFIDLGAGRQALLTAEAGARPVEGSALDVEVTAEARADKIPVVRQIGPGQGEPVRIAKAADLTERLQSFGPGMEILTGDAAREAADLAEEAALATEFPLAGGLNLSVERTRGFIAVDVDFSRAQAGKRAVLDANVRAVREAARINRLKGQGGPIVIDLVGKAAEHAEILAAAKSAFEPDQPGVVIAGLSRLGLLEAAVPWRETPVAERLLDVDGSPRIETIACRLVRALERAGRSDPGRRFAAACSPAVAAVLEPLVVKLGPRFSVRSEVGMTGARSDICPA